MAITASRLGSAPITIDWSHILKKHDSDPDLLNETWNHLKKRFNSRDVGFYDSPIDQEISQVQEAQSLAEDILKRNEFTDCLILGIGEAPLALSAYSLASKTKEKILF